CAGLARGLRLRRRRGRRCRLGGRVAGLDGLLRHRRAAGQGQREAGEGRKDGSPEKKSPGECATWPEKVWAARTEGPVTASLHPAGMALPAWPTSPGRGPLASNRASFPLRRRAIIGARSVVQQNKG